MQSIHRYTLYLFLFTTSHIALGMLSKIEKMILVRETSRIGINHIKHAIDKAPKPEPIEPNGYKIYPALTVHDEFYHNDYKSNDLTRLVFDTITKIEKKNDYIPEHKTQITKSAFIVTMPTNKLGRYTRYLHDYDHGIHCIHTTSHFDKESLQEFLIEHKPQE